MTKRGEYRPTQKRNWRQQSMPCHAALDDIQQRIEDYLLAVKAESLVEVKLTLATVIEAAVNYVYREWVERGVLYSDEQYDRAMQVYATVAIINPRKHVVTTTYLKEETAQKIEALGDYVAATRLEKVPYLRTTRWVKTYNRKLLIILALHAFAESLG